MKDGSLKLVRYDAAKKALAAYTSVDEVRNYHDQAQAIKAYAKLAGDYQLEIDAAAARIRSERRLGQLMAEMPKAKPPGVKKDRVHSRPDVPTLDAMGIDKHLADAARKAASIDEQVFDDILDRHRERNQVVTLASLTRSVHVSHNSGENEWYTPKEYIEAARRTMGTIDLDPASSPKAQKIVGAKKFFTKSQDGLGQRWAGNVWLNPPYHKTLIAEFCKKLCDEIVEGDIDQSVLLVNNASETSWFQICFERCDGVCFPKGRIRFLNERLEPENTPLQGQCLMYFGGHAEYFAENFSQFGACRGVHNE